MRVRLFTYEYPPFHGGIAAYLGAMVRAAPPTVAVEVIVPPKGEHWLVSSWKNLRSADKYDLFLVSHVLPAGYAAWLQKAFCRRPYAVIVHGTDILTARSGTWKRRLMRFVLRHACLVIANSRYTAGLAKEEGAVRIEIAPPGVEIGSVPAAERRSHQMISVGRLVARKGFDDGIAALASIKEDFPDATYVIIGDGPDKGRLEKLADEAGMSDSVKILSSADDAEKAKRLRESSVFVLPAKPVGTDIEGFGIVTLEAAAAGLPAVVGNSGGAAEPVIDGVTGILIEPGNRQALAAAVKRLFGDQSAARRMGEAGRGFVADEYSVAKSAERFWRLIEAA